MRAKLLLLLLPLAVVAACLTTRSEGDRCNPLESHDECGGGSLVCTQSAACPEAYCCPPNASSSTNPYCRADPSVCPTDAGSSGDDGGDATADAAPDGDGASE
jgi:hypothetical protein